MSVKDRVIAIEVKSNGNATIDGAYVYETDIKEHLKSLKKVGFYKFHVTPYCGLVSNYQVNKVKDIVDNLK